MVILVLGVSGSGKSTVSKELAIQLKGSYIDADDFHDEFCINKMKSGQPLTDEDRWPWLLRINEYLLVSPSEIIVLACSALKNNYREVLLKNIDEYQMVYLKGSFNIIHSRLLERNNHFMSERLLLSQFETLEEPQNALIVNIDNSIEKIISEIKSKIAY